jgi:peptidoglycan/xylan/chitin deacetylase (PgdA/CDA1 family)
LVIALGLGGCAKPPQERALDPVAPLAHAYQNTDAVLTTASVRTMADPILNQPKPERLFSHSSLVGRTIMVGSTAEIALAPGEVILTFDDGPRPGKTEAILDTLDGYGVSGTFMMLGRAALTHPELAQSVALRGHTIGTHTYDHARLTELSNAEAAAEIARGEEAVATALAPIGQGPSRFFRFPYLAQTGVMRTSLMASNVIVLDVDIDSKDYFDDAPETVMMRTLERLDAQGSGIILFHDIHDRTVAMLPAFLEALRTRGYSVVRLRAKDDALFGRDIITAQSMANPGE